MTLESDTRTSRADIIEALGNINREAKREQYIIGTAAYPSRWDCLHHLLDGLLDDLAGR